MMVGQVISTLVKNFSEGNDFFRVLLRVFQEVGICLDCSFLDFVFVHE
jgi:hypothetical protein